MSFAYPSRPAHFALQDISLEIPAHKTTWIVGRSGSGKSTLGNMLVKAYQPQCGIITLNGYPLDAVDTKWLRENVTLVHQNSVLFNDTILKNIALGKGDEAYVTLEEASSALTVAGGWGMLMEFPESWQTYVGLGGCRLSGGQKQRVRRYSFA